VRRIIGDPRSRCARLLEGSSGSQGNDCSSEEGLPAATVNTDRVFAIPVDGGGGCI
jgi:hypothetical protein